MERESQMKPLPLSNESDYEKTARTSETPTARSFQYLILMNIQEQVFDKQENSSIFRSFSKRVHMPCGLFPNT